MTSPKRGSAKESKSIAFKKRLESAMHYAHFSIKEGFSDPADWNNLTQSQFIDKAEHDGDRGDIAADAARKGEA